MTKLVAHVADDIEMCMERHHALPSKRVLTEPFGVPLRAVEARAGFVEPRTCLPRRRTWCAAEGCDLGLRAA